MNNFHWSHAPIIYHYGWVIWWVMRRIICWWALRADFHFNFRSGKLARKWLQFLLENMTNCLETFCNLFHNLWNSKQLLPKALYSALHLLCTHSTRGGNQMKKINFLVNPKWILLSFQYIRMVKKEFLIIGSILTLHI